MKKNPNDRFYHIRDAIIAVLSFEPVDLSDIKTYSAVVYQLQIIGEATKHAAKTIKARHPEIPWKKIASFRNYAVHEYFMLDIKAIQKALKMLPGMLKHIEAIIKEIES